MRMQEQSSWKRFREGRREPDAIAAPEGERRVTPVEVNRTVQGRESMRQATERRRTVEEGMKSALSRVTCDPRPTASFMVPMPIALMEEPLTPFTRQFMMGQRDRKSEHSGDICVVQPLLSRNGEDAREASEVQVWERMGETEIADRSASLECAIQSTEALILSWRSSHTAPAYSSKLPGIMASATKSAMSSVKSEI